MILQGKFVHIALLVLIIVGLLSCQQTQKLKAIHIIGDYTFASGSDFIADSCIFSINEELECRFCLGINVPFLDRPFLPNHASHLKNNIHPAPIKAVSGKIKKNEYQFFKPTDDEQTDELKWVIYINKKGNYILRVYSSAPNNANIIIMVERQLYKIK
jgi:hypothetical protein